MSNVRPKGDVVIPVWFLHKTIQLEIEKLKTKAKKKKRERENISLFYNIVQKTLCALEACTVALMSKDVARTRNVM